MKENTHLNKNQTNKKPTQENPNSLGNNLACKLLQKEAGAFRVFLRL